MSSIGLPGSLLRPQCLDIWKEAGARTWEGLRQGGLTLEAVPLLGSQQLLPQVRASSNLTAVVILWAKYKNLQVDMTWGEDG